MHAIDEIARMMAMDAAAHGGSTAPVDSYTKSETDALLEQKADKSEVTESVTAAVAQIVANAPEDFDTLKEMSDWIASHEDSAAAMNTAILQNAADIEAVETQQTEQATEISAAAEGVYLNRSTLGYQRKNLLKNTAVTKTQDGVTFTVNDNGSVTVNGTATATTWFILSNSNKIFSGMYKLTSGIVGYGGNIMVVIAPKVSLESVILKSTNAAKELSSMDGLIYAIRIQKGFTADNITIYPMLRYAEITDDTYEPYKPSVQEQIDSLTNQAAINKSTLGYQRKNLLKNTAETTTTSGITFTVNEDKSVKITGTASSSNYVNLIVFSDVLPNRKVIISGCPNGGSANTYRIRVGKITSSDTNGEYLGVEYGNGIELIPDGISKYTVMLQVAATFAANGQVFYPMIRYAEIQDDTYEPYKPSVQEQINALTERISALESN